MTLTLVEDGWEGETGHKQVIKHKTIAEEVTVRRVGKWGSVMGHKRVLAR